MTREEAIEVVRKNLPHLGIGATEMTDALGTLIPELKEIEDERIRKELKEAFEAYDIESKWNGIPIRSIFAWLERQKEQKPAECIEDSVKFEEGFKAGRESGLRDGQKYVLNNLDSYGLCKPAEWSEEDREAIDMCLDAIPKAWKTKSGILLTKWLRDKLNSCSQPKQEWSEEDKEKIVTISEIIEHCTTIPYSGGTLTLNKEYKKELLCFIRTLRPSWKPSEEQMKAFEDAMSYIPEFYKPKSNLASLLRDLNKLM